MKLLDDDDYELRERAIWLGIRSLSLRIYECDTGVRISVCHRGREADDAIEELWVAYVEGESTE